MRDWLFSTLTNFANDVSVRLGNRITGLAIWCNGKSDEVEAARWQAVDYITTLIASAPWPFDQALNWFLTLCISYIINPAFTAVRTIFAWSSYYIGTFYENWSYMYIPERWLRDIILNIRDRIINLLDDTATLVTAARTWVSQLVTSVQGTLQGGIDALNVWRASISTWIGQNLYNPLQAVIADITELGTEVFNLGTSVRAITSDPVYWMWSRLEPYLRQKVSDWLNSIWYTRI